MSQPRHIASLDGLRGLAALAVLGSHLDLFAPMPPGAPDLHAGGEGVALFFALSGFLMAWLYGNRPFTRAGIADYLVHRFARIYPVYLLAVVVTWLLYQATDWPMLERMAGLDGLVRHGMALGSAAVFWSIPPEIQFYVFFVLLWYGASGARFGFEVLVLTGCLLAALIFLGFPGPGIMLASKLPFFLFGAAAGYLFLRKGAPSVPPGPVTGLAALGLVAFLFGARYAGWSMPDHWGASGPIYSTGPALVAAFIVWLVALEQPVSARVLASRPLRFFGAISFSLYLFHLPVMYLVTRLLAPVLPPYLALIPAILATVLVAWLSWRLVERPARAGLVGAWRRRGAAAEVAPAPQRVV